MHGWIALTLTVVGVAALNVGLMHLARRRWDHDFERLDTAEPDDVAGSADGRYDRRKRRR